MFENVLHNFRHPLVFLSTNFSLLECDLFRPNIEIDSSDKQYRITIEVPGVNEKDIKLELEPAGNTLTIHSEKIRKGFWNA